MRHKAHENTKMFYTHHQKKHKSQIIGLVTLTY